MSEPKNGDPAIDKDARDLLVILKKYGGTFYKNLSYEIIGEFVEELGRHKGLADRHYGIKILQKRGGEKGAERAKNSVKRMMTTLEKALATPPNIDGTVERCGF